MIQRIFSSCLLMVLIACQHPTYKEPHVRIETAYGTVELELYPDKAPQTVAAFLKNVNAGVYNNSSFYRVVKADDATGSMHIGIIQGGVYKQTNPPKLAFIPHESTQRSGLTHTDGAVSMARTAPGTASSEFFICLGDQSTLDSGRRGSPDAQGFAAFGKVFSGMSVVRKIQDQPYTGDAFLQPVRIQSIQQL
jgi:peptidyl-prolyl cis-trans isomerase A (cyclophilin A)